KILVKLLFQRDGGVLELWNLHPRVMFVLPGNAEVLHNVICLSGKTTVDCHSPSCIYLGHLEEVSWLGQQGVWRPQRPFVSYLRCLSCPGLALGRGLASPGPAIGRQLSLSRFPVRSP